MVLVPAGNLHDAVEPLLKLVNKRVVHVHSVFKLLQYQLVPFKRSSALFLLQLFVLVIRDQIVEVAFGGYGDVVHALHKLLVEVISHPTLFHNL